VTGPLAQRRQRPRRRITPNTNTSTTTMISTHNHVDMAASLVGAGQFAVTLLSPTRASNSVTARRPPGPGSTAVLRAGSRGPCTPRPTRRSGLAGCGPARPGRRPRVSPGGPSPSGHAQPAEPQPNRPAPQERRTRQASPDPTRPQRPRPAEYGEARESLPAWLGNNPSMAVRCAMADARRRRQTRWCAPSAKPELAPMTAAPLGSPGTTPLNAARSTKAGTSRRRPARGNTASELPGPMVSSTRWPLQRGHPCRRGRRSTPHGGTPLLMLPATARTAVLRSANRAVCQVYLDSSPADSTHQGLVRPCRGTTPLIIRLIRLVPSGANAHRPRTPRKQGRSRLRVEC
jgi:hypothetical protein